MTRRLFLSLGKALGLVVAAAAALPPLLFWWRSAGSGGAAEAWIDLGPALDIPENEWLPRKFSYERRDRWRYAVTEELVYVHRVEHDVTVLTAVCPHARCLVQTEGEGFACRCHRSAFDASGRVVSGPSPRPLDPLEWRVRRGHLFVRYQQFRPGVAASEALDT